MNWYGEGDKRKAYLTCAETAKLVRAALKEAFPGQKFSVRSETYSMGASIDVSWLDGPTSGEVDQILRVFQAATFDGMTDYKGGSEHRCTTEIKVGRETIPAGTLIHFGADWVKPHRQFSEGFSARAAKAVEHLRVNHAAEYCRFMNGPAIHCREHPERVVSLLAPRPSPLAESFELVRTY